MLRNTRNSTSTAASAIFELDAEPEPQHEQRRQRDLGQRVERVEIGVEQPAGERRDAEPDAEHDAADRADEEAHARWRRPSPRCARKIEPSSVQPQQPRADVDRIGDEEIVDQPARRALPEQQHHDAERDLAQHHRSRCRARRGRHSPASSREPRRLELAVGRGHTRSSWYSTRSRSHSAS